MKGDTPAGATGWLARGEHEVPQSTDWLSPGEADAVGRIRFTKRRTEFLLRRWVAKQAVTAAVGLPVDLPSLATVEVRNLPTGAPYVQVGGAPLGLDISLTDRAGWAVCLVGAGLGRLGCDVEVVEPRSAGFISDFFTGAEQAHVASLPTADRDAAANLIWSAKESALKVLQTGLRRDTRTVDVVIREPAPGASDDPEAGWGRLEIRTDEGGLLPGWWRRDGTFLVTVASEHALPAPRALTGSGDLATARPVHSWVHSPLAR
ncbi:MAG: 4'-phosphopantetheinyl transferase family protein [Nocardioidaceae bacterium]